MSTHQPKFTPPQCRATARRKPQRQRHLGTNAQMDGPVLCRPCALIRNVIPGVAALGVEAPWRYSEQRSRSRQQVGASKLPTNLRSAKLHGSVIN